MPGIETSSDDQRGQFLFLRECDRTWGKKNPEVTECQVQMALGASIPCWWLDQRPSAKLLVRTAEEIRHNQHKNAEARQSHIKRSANDSAS